MSTAPPNTKRAADAAATTGDELAFAGEVLRAEADGIASLLGRLDASFTRALDLLEACAADDGAILVTGLGKSGIIGRKISATLASLGFPSHEVHPSEAMHGDLGRISRRDCVIALSNSGETEEVISLVHSLKQDGVRVLAITGGRGGSTLSRLADVCLALGQIDEAGDLGLAPTCSTTATLAMGDALSLTLARRCRVSADQFAKRHPGGRLGGLLRPIVDVIRFRVEENLPVVTEALSLTDALAHAESIPRRPGAMLITDDAGTLIGIFTDADLRRLILGRREALERSIGDVMTRHPRTLGAEALVRDAVSMVREHRQDEIPIIDDAGRPIGLLDVQDLMALRVVET